MGTSSRDRDLGMNRSISRRDLLQGLGALTGAALLPGKALADRVLELERAKGAVYPPSRTGLRGSHPGSFEVAHALAREGRRDWGPVEGRDAGIYDLVVVGAGISGLAAAHFYRKAHPGARILILDNHEDFGGHAIRNEFQAGGRNLIGYGGSQALEEPSDYAAITKTLLDDIGVDLDRFNKSYDREFLKRHGLGGWVFFNRKHWGVDRLVPYDLGGLRYTLPLAEHEGSIKDAVAAMPMSDGARAQMLKLLTSKDDVFPGKSEARRWEILGSISYLVYLYRHLGVTEREVYKALGPLTTDLGAAIESVPASDAIYYIGLPGYEASGLPDVENLEPYIHHFPDGNASIARLLVRQMIPHAAPGTTMDDVVLSRFDYGKLDLEGSSVRLRLSSTVVSATHDGKPGSAKSVVLSYVRSGRHGQVRAKHCVMACYNAIIPAICPELPKRQRTALSRCLKVPVQYTNVALGNWRAWKRLGLGAVSAPGSYHINAMLDFPVDMGGYEFSAGPDHPIVVHMERFFPLPNSGLSKREQAPLGRHQMLSTPFETIERNTREQLAATLAGTDFDPARDIEAITVNRWPHGYATRDWLEDEYFEDLDHKRYWYVRGRQPFGRIAIANSDAGASASVDMAVRQAHRAVGELIE